MGNKPTITWAEFEVQCKGLAARWGHLNGSLSGVYGVPTAGALVALEVARTLAQPMLEVPAPGCLVVDGVADSGDALRRVLDQLERVGATCHTDALYRLPRCSVALPNAMSLDRPVQFPWENHSGDLPGDGRAPANAVSQLLTFLGEDPTREGLVDTPKRVTRALREMTAGYSEDPAAILARNFEEKCDGLILVRGIEFTSLCQHHMLPFTGAATVAYLPSDRVVGLSKLARLVQCFARRLQVQERLTTQIAEAVETHLQAKGVGVLVRARHSCMSCRGVRQTAEMVTSSMLGELRDNPETRAEFFSLAG